MRSEIIPANIILEACLDSLDHALRSDGQGVQQVEICSRLDLDGLSPSLELVTSIQKQCSAIPKVMIRPRPGDFIYTDEEVQLMIEEIKLWKGRGISQIVLGVLTKDHTVHVEHLEQLCHVAIGMEVTFHKAIDIVPDPLQAIQEIKKFDNIKYILSSGQEPTAWKGRELLQKMIKECAGDIHIIVAGKVRYHNLITLQEATGAIYFHGQGF